MDTKTLCSNHEDFIANIRAVNERVEVEPDIVDLIEAYSRLRLQDSEDIDFYGSEEDPLDDEEIKSFLDKNAHMDERALSFLQSYAYEMRRRGRPFIINTRHLANVLGITEEELEQLSGNHDQYYSSFQINKSSGKKRVILAPKPAMKGIQGKIHHKLLCRVIPHAKAHGFIRGRSILTNISEHLGKEIIIKMDIKDFFPTIFHSRVLGLFLYLGYPKNVAENLAMLTTFKGRLPIGAPTSPSIANLICRKMDCRFMKLGESIGFSYTRYADDIAISGSNKSLNSYIPFFKSIINEEGFEVNEEKLRILRKGGRQRVTGIVVNKKPNVRRTEVKRLRAVIHNCQKRDIEAQKKLWAASIGITDLDLYSIGAFKASLQGKIGFVKMVNQKVGERLYKAFQEIPWPV